MGHAAPAHSCISISALMHLLDASRHPCMEVPALPLSVAAAFSPEPLTALAPLVLLVHEGRGHVAPAGPRGRASAWSSLVARWRRSRPRPCRHHCAVLIGRWRCQPGLDSVVLCAAAGRHHVPQYDSHLRGPLRGGGHARVDDDIVLRQVGERDHRAGAHTSHNT